MRRVFLDTETTGLDARGGDRIVEVGCVEMIGRRLSGRRLHRYVNPERPVPIEAQRIHGLGDAFLADKPKFADIASELAEFLAGAELLIHNADFDLGFLDAEFARLDMPPARACCASVVDTMKMARDLRPGKRNSLDALCAEYGIDNSERDFHGALLDAELLADVWLAMTRGQESLLIDTAPVLPAATLPLPAGDRPPLRVLVAAEDELVEHRRLLEDIQRASRGKCLWLGGSEAG